MLSTLRAIAHTILGKTGKPDRVDMATRMAMEADFSDRREPTATREPIPDHIDPLEELDRTLRERK